MLDTAGYLANASMEAFRAKSKNLRNAAQAVGRAINACDICVTSVHRGLDPVVTTRSSQIDVLWARSSNFQHIRY